MITKTNQSLSDVFNVEPTAQDVITVEAAAQSTEILDNPASTDFEIARAAMHNILLKGSTAIDNALIIANGNEEADSYNAVSNLIGKMTEASTKLMGLHEMKAKITKPAAPNSGQPEQNVPGNVSISGPVFVGTTSELAKIVMQQRKPTNIIQQGD